MFDRSDPGAVDGRLSRTPVIRVVVMPGNHVMTLKAWAMAAEVSDSHLV